MMSRNVGGNLVTFVAYILGLIVVFGLVLLLGVNIGGCGGTPSLLPELRYRGLDCAAQCRDTERDIRLFWKRHNPDGTISTYCECMP